MGVGKDIKSQDKCNILSSSFHHSSSSYLLVFVSGSYKIVEIRNVTTGDVFMSIIFVYLEKIKLLVVMIKNSIGRIVWTTCLCICNKNQRKLQKIWDAQCTCLYHLALVVSTHFLSLDLLCWFFPSFNNDVMSQMYVATKHSIIKDD